MKSERAIFDPERMGRREPEERLDRLAHETIGAAIEVHRHLGPGFLECVYQKAMEIELKLRGISFARELPIEITYKGQGIGENKLDFLVDHSLILELKAVEQLAAVHTAQVLSYLKATRQKLGLLINFNVPVLKEGIRRIAL